ncbi:hypothetical protein VTO42DRAFT_3992 [Malbranchea cinnamomea]
MKFAKELEQELVPEWRAKYLNYKGGKKKVKAIARALRHAEQHSPWTPGRRSRGAIFLDHHPSTTPHERPRLRQFNAHRAHTVPAHVSEIEQVHPPLSAAPAAGPSTLPASWTPSVPDHLAGPGRREHQPLRPSNSCGLDRRESYGSIARSPSPGARQSPPSSLDLPAPALDPATAEYPPKTLVGRADGIAASPGGNRDDSLGRGRSPRTTSRYGILPGPKNIFRTMGNSNRDHSPANKRPMLTRLFSSKVDNNAQLPSHHFPTEAYVEVRIREAEFFNFLDKELAKIESFYRAKEDEASNRLATLRTQLHLMHDARAEELRSKKQSRDTSKKSVENGVSTLEKRRVFGSSFVGRGSSKKTDQHRETGAPVPRLTVGNDYRDYVRRQPVPNVPYRSAKRKLKLALLEFYRGLELLKAYADLNQKAFRKIIKKYDKATNARPTGRYMSEKVNKAWFVQSEVVENHLVAVEDLYTRYFERGNRKAAINKLRGKVFRPQDHSSSAYRNGLTCGAGLVLGIQGLVYAYGHLRSDDDTIRAQTGSLLQIYAGYFLVLLHFLLFCLDCMVWSGSKINYAFVFEFDTRHVLDWRQLAEIPCFFVFLEGLIIWLNFRWVNDMFIYYPLVLIAVTVAIIFLPVRILYHRSRAWWAYSNWRLLFSGFYPVEFRDFFLGDMYCSQSYAMGNIALFFCLYAKSWDEPSQCNSSRSRLMGFLTALPPIWRAFQCLRRYRDTKDAFPHIVNLCKYAFSILYAMTLSLYRIGRTDHYRAAFVVCACITAIYTSVWDLAMDWSLGNPHSKSPFLRDFLAFRRRWVYYMAIVIDPILRFSWILYILDTSETQHSALLSFVIALLEVCRRGMWSIFRVENEHCANVCRFRASRDIPLPYDLSASSAALPSSQPVGTQGLDSDVTDIPPRATGADVERLAASGPLRHRRPSQVSDGGGTLSRVGTLLATAHTQDFERRKDRGLSDKNRHSPEAHPRRDSSTEDEAEEDDDEGEDNRPATMEHSLRVESEDLFDEDQGHPHRP